MESSMEISVLLGKIQDLERELNSLKDELAEAGIVSTEDQDLAAFPEDPALKYMGGMGLNENAIRGDSEMLREHIEPDYRVMDGRPPRTREDRSIDWARGENAVLRLYDWADVTKRTYDLFTDQKNPNADENDDGVRFLARVWKDPKNPEKGATLRYYKLLRYQKTTCDESDSDSDSDSDGDEV